MRRPGSIRLRVTAVAALAVALVLLVAGLTVVRTQRAALTEDVDDTAVAVADGVAADVATGTLPDVLVVAGDDDTAAQVVAADGSVLIATANVEGEPPLAAATDRRRIVTRDHLPHDETRFRLLSEPVTTASGPATVHVAVTLDDVDGSVGALVRSLTWTAPVVLIALAAVVWFVVGRTLRPVEESTRRQQRFVADASHELRSPLTRIRTELEVDLAHPDRADPMATHRSVLEEAERLQHLVDDLLQLARSDARAGAGRREPVDLDDLVLAEAERLRAGGGVRVERSGVSGAQVVGDPAELARVVTNLADNAARHARTEVAFTLAEHEGTAVLTVTDDGPGIPADQHDRVFERFARLDDARSAAAGGTGLGLAITKDIVTRHGGTVVVDPDHTGGARIVVRLPAGGP